MLPSVTDSPDDLYPHRFRTLGDFCAATAGHQHDDAVEATIEWMLIPIQRALGLPGFASELDRPQIDERTRVFLNLIYTIMLEKAGELRGHRARIGDERYPPDND